MLLLFSFFYRSIHKTKRVYSAVFRCRSIPLHMYYETWTKKTSRQKRARSWKKRGTISLRGQRRSSSSSYHLPRQLLSAPPFLPLPPEDPWPRPRVASDPNRKCTLFAFPKKKINNDIGIYTFPSSCSATSPASLAIPAKTESFLASRASGESNSATRPASITMICDLTQN